MPVHQRLLPQHGLSNLFELGVASKDFDAILAFNFAPVFGARNFLLVFDMMFAEQPEWFTRAERIYFSQIGPSVRRAAATYTISASEVERIKRVCRVQRLPTNIGLALPEEFVSAMPIPPNFMVPEKFMLAVGRLNARKNLGVAALTLYEAGILSPAFPLIVVGSPDGADPRLDRLRDAIKAGAVIFAGALTDGELKWLYSHCAVFIFPSLDEGFGLPVLEAVSCGARIALSDIPAFREFGNVGVFFDPTSPIEILGAVRRALEPSDVESVWEWPRRFHWDSVVTSLRNDIFETLRLP